MVKHFTTEELKALADFYGSPVGKSAMQKFGAYMADIMPVMQAEIMKAQAKTEPLTSQKQTRIAAAHERDFLKHCYALVLRRIFSPLIARRQAC